MVHGGTNDLRNHDKSPQEIADDLLCIGGTAKSLGVEHVFFSTVVVRRDGVQMDRKRKAVNAILRDKCNTIDNFNFIGNDNIIFEDINEFDRVHLNESGSVKLANNVLTALNDLH